MDLQKFIRSQIYRGWAIIRPYGQKTKWFIVIRFPQILNSNEFIINTKIDRQAFNWIKKNHKAVSIIIPTYKDFNLTKKCINTILDDPHQPKDLQILIVDDGSPKEFQQKLLTLKNSKVEVLLKDKNEGYSSAINTALEKVQKGDVVILNNDILCLKGWLAHLQVSAYRSKDTGIVGPKLLYPNKTIQFAGGTRNRGIPVWFDHIYRFKAASYPPANLEREVLYITGACMYIKDRVLKKVGKFDEKFRMGFEDVDYCLRARGLGLKNIYCPTSNLVHLESATRGRQIKESALKSLTYFWTKWGKHFNNRKVLNNKKLNIIYVLHDTGVGGGHRDVFEHINHLNKLGHNVKLYALAGQPKWFDLNIEVTKFVDYPSMECELEKQDAIKIACWWESGESVWRSSLIKGIPIFFVQDIETSYYRDDKSQSTKVLATYRKEFNYLTISGWNQKQLKKLDINASLISPGIDLKNFYPQKKLIRQKNVVLVIGRRLYLKNLELTLEAWKQIMNEVELWIFGIDPSIYHNLKSKYPDAKIKYFHKPTDQEVAQFYNQATVFVQTSIHEGFCLPALEAMACGCPVITTNSDGNMDFCIDNKNCLMVNQNVDAVASKIKSLIKNPKLQDKLRKEGFITAKQYRWEIKIKQLEKFYYKLAQKGLYSADIEAKFNLKQLN